MNISPTQHRLAWVCTVLALFVVSSRAVAQCDIAVPSFPQPVQITMYLDAVNGTTRLERQTVAPGIISSSCIPPYAPMRVRFYDDAAKTSPAGGFPFRIYDCHDITTALNPAKKVWVAVNDGVNYPASESPSVGLQVTIQDITAPLVGPLLSVLVNTADDGNFGDCEFQDASLLNIGLTPVMNSIGLVLNPGQYTDNTYNGCPSGVKVSYEIDFDNISGYPDLPDTPGNDAGIHAFPIGVSTVTYHVRDASGNETSFSLDVSVTDNEDPTINCPISILEFTSTNACTSLVTVPSDASDNCTSLEVAWAAVGASPASGFGDLQANFPVGTTTVTYTATDGGGLTATCTFDVQVVDNQLPTITCPASVTKTANAVNCTYTTVGTEFDATGLGDNCSFTPSATNPINTKDGTNSLAGEVFPLGPTTVIWTVTDVNANAKTCSFVVTVKDNTPPSVTYNVNLGPFNVTPGDCSKVATFTEPSNTTPGSVDCDGPVILTRDSVFVNGVYAPGFLAAAPAFNPAVTGTVTTQFPVGVTKIQYTWRDAANNKTFRYITVTVVENEKPVAKCKNGPLFKNLDPTTGALELAVGDVDNGSTDNCGINNYTILPQLLDCEDVNVPTLLTMTVTDNAGNTSSCTVQIIVYDVTAPTVVCPVNPTVASTNNCTATVPGLLIQRALVLPALPGQYHDNSSDCQLIELSYSLNGGAFSTPVLNTLNLSSQVFNTGATTVTLRVRDASANASTCIFTVNVTDQQGPSFTPGSVAIGSTLTVNANLGGCLAQVNWTEPQVAADCSLPATLTRSHAPGSFFYFGPTTVTYTATDAVGNASTYTFIVNVVDIQKPKAVCQTYTAALNASGSVVVTASQIDGGSTDNCFFDYITTSYGPFTCANLGNNAVMLKIKDGSGNRDSCTANIVVVDNLAPVANCAALANIDLNAAGQNLFAASSLNGTSADNCSGNLTYTLSVDGSAFATTFPFTCAHLGARTLVLKATDGGGNTSTCSQIVTVRDVTAPTFTVPADKTVRCYESIAATNTGSFSNLADACDANPTITFSDAVVIGCGGSQTITRTWTATDVSLNVRTGTQVISVVDDVKPTFLLPAVVNLNTDNANTCVAPYVASVSATTLKDSCTSFVDLQVTYTVDYPNPAYGYVDLVTPTTGTTIPTFSSSYPVGTTVITWIAKDQCGNTKLFTQSIVVKDTKPPVFSYSKCGQTYTLPSTPGSCTQLYAWTRPVLTDVFECTPITVTENFSDPTVKSFVDLVNPFIFGGPSTSVTAQFSAGETTVTYLATDAAGNTSTCTFKVKILDTQAPDVICPGNQTLATTCATAVVPSYLNNAQVQDNCPTNVTLTQSPASGTALSAVVANPVAGSTFIVKLLAVDHNANNGRDSCTFTVTLADGAAPVPVQQTLPPIFGHCGRDTVYAPLALDACNPNDSIYGTPSAQVGMFLVTDPPSYFLEVGSYVITWAYNDGNGNISTQQQNINLQLDIFPPEAKCKPAFTINLDSVGEASITTSMIDNASTDPDGCGSIGLTLSQASFDCSDEGLNNIKLTVTDNAGNTATCVTAVTVKDVTLPDSLVVPADTLIQACATIPIAPAISTVDLCSGTIQAVLTTTSTQATSGFNKYNYTITRLWVATDSSGNSVSAQQVITIKDTLAPVFAANTPTAITRATSASNSDCKANVRINIGQYVTECATGVTVVSSPIGYSVTDTIERLFVGVHTFVFTATDSSGNTATHTIVVTVADSTLPTAVCINGISAALQNSGMVTVNVSQFNNNSFDNCTMTDSLSLLIQRLDSVATPTPTLTYDCSDADGVTHRPVKLYVRDRNGNVSSCQTYIVIQDNAAPVFTFCPPSKTVDCQVSLDPAMNSNGQATATDNCLANLTLTYSDSVTFGNGPLACVLVTRTWLAKDLPGNTATCVQTFTIQDNKPPIFSTLPADASISCNDPLVTPPIVTATDNCSAPADIDIVYQEVKTDTAVGACGQYSYKVQRTWTATDECGNSAVHTQNITVSDTQAPLFPGLQDTLVVLSANNAPSANCTVLVALNVGPSLSDCTPSSALVITHDSPFATSGADASGSYPIGDTKVIFTATDLCGNVGKDSVIVSVKDNSIPTVICNNNVVVALGSTGSAVLQASDINLGSTDNCGIDTMFLSTATFNCSDIGDNSVVLTVIDNNGNSNSCTVNVEVSIGPNVGFSLNTTAIPETYFGFADGAVKAVATGGSGAFTYAWLPDTTQTTPVIDSLSAGIYIVTVLDTVTHCIQTDTAVVEAGKKITVDIDSVSGSPNQLVQVPVTVDNFYQVNGFSFGVISIDTAVGTIVSTSMLNPVLVGFSANVSNGKANPLWVGGTPVTLPNGTLLFNVEVQLKPDAVIGAITPIKVAEPLQFLQNIGGAPTVTMIDTFNGSITVIPNANIVKIGGDIQTWKVPTKPVPNVNVALTGSVTANQVTSADGTYLFSVPLASNTIVTPTKVTAGNDKVSAADLLLIQNHIFGNLLTSPYQWVAANVNNSGGPNPITLADYLLIQLVVLGTNQHIQGSPDWKFIPKSYVFPTPNPLVIPFPTTISHTPATMDFLDDDFVAVRMGDVNGNIVPEFTSNETDDRSAETFHFRLDDRSFNAGEVITVPFKASDFTNRQAYQMTIEFDPSVFALENIGKGALNLTDDQFGTAHLSDGSLTTVWVGREPVTFRDDEVLFTLSFRTLQAGRSLREVLHPGSSVTTAEAYDRDGKTMKIDFDFAQSADVVDEHDFALYQNQPNPFQNQTTIGFRLPTASRATLRVFNASGRLVKTVVGDFDKGYNELNFRPDELGAAGVYWYELETPLHSDRKKMVLLK